jgi:hypothetical protein
LFLISETIGTPVYELEQNMSTSEFFEWGEWFDIKRKAELKAHKEAEAKAKRGRK